MNNTEMVQVKDSTQHKETARSLVAQAEAAVVTNDMQQEEATELGKNIKQWIQDAEMFFDPEIKQAFALHRSLTQKRSNIVDPVKSALRALSQKVGLYQEEQRRKKAEEEEKARQAAEAKQKKEQDRLLEQAQEAEVQGDVAKAEDLVEKAENHYVPPRVVAPVMKPKGTILRYDIDVLVKNQKLIPDEFKIVDIAKLRRRYKESKYTLNVNGVQFVRRPSTGFRR